jgi:hypothetical protein
MSDMSEKESKERFIQGLKKAASYAREIARLTGSPMWKQIAFTVDEIRRNGTKLMSMTAITRFDALKMLDVREQKISAELNNTVQ